MPIICCHARGATREFFILHPRIIEEAKAEMLRYCPCNHASSHIFFLMMNSQILEGVFAIIIASPVLK